MSPSPMLVSPRVHEMYRQLLARSEARQRARQEGTPLPCAKCSAPMFVHRDLDRDVCRACAAKVVPICTECGDLMRGGSSHLEGLHERDPGFVDGEYAHEECDCEMVAVRYWCESCRWSGLFDPAEPKRQIACLVPRRA